MKTILPITFLCCLSTIGSNTYCQTNGNRVDSVIMYLSAYGVESDNFPSIDVYINFLNDSSNCHKSYYDPVYKPSNYILKQKEIKSILGILQNSNLEKLKKEYAVLESDQPTSTTIIYTSKRKFEIKDYGLKGESPLPELYKIIYKF